MDTISPSAIKSPSLRLGLAGAVIALASACGSTSDPLDARPTVQDSASAETTTAPAAPATTAVATTAGCGSQCPLTVEQQQAVDDFFDAYNGDDWDAVLATISEPEPSWQMAPSLIADVDDLRADFQWSAAMDETWSPTGCIDQYGVVVCHVEMEDALVRALASLGLPPSVCSLSFSVDDEGVQLERYDLLSGCHNLYDAAMHAYGGWFEANHPDEAPIQGFHYRGWNTSDESAGARAAAHVDEFRAAAVEMLGEDGDISTFRSAG